MILETAVEASSADMWWKSIDRYSKDYIEMQTKQNVKFYVTPDSVLKTQLDVWDAIAAKKSAENPFFKRVYESQLAFAERAVKWQVDTMITAGMAYNQAFGKKPAAKAAAKKA